MTSASTVQQITTAEQLLHLRHEGRSELLRGELKLMNPAGCEHGWIVSRIGGRLDVFVDDHALGLVYGAETGFVLESDPDTVRAPDVAFVRRDRVPTEPSRGFFPGAPDLAVEVLSPDDRPSYVQDKTQQWLDSGATQVWIVDPKDETVSLFSASEPAQVLSRGDDLTGGDLLPGFSMPIAEIFKRL